jgi:hypothetical protein
MIMFAFFIEKNARIFIWFFKEVFVVVKGVKFTGNWHVTQVFESKLIVISDKHNGIIIFYY